VLELEVQLETPEDQLSLTVVIVELHQFVQQEVVLGRVQQAEMVEQHRLEVVTLEVVVVMEVQLQQMLEEEAAAAAELVV
jgi:hypothetical protein